MVFNWKYRALGWFSLPSIWFFQIILVAITPMVDLFLLTSLPFGAWRAVLPFVIAIQFLLTLSAVYVLSVLHVFFRDTQYLLGVFLLVGLYLSPVFYPVQSVPVEWRGWFALNPLVHILEAYRAVLIHGRYPDVSPLLLVAAVSIAILVPSYRKFVRSSHWFIEEVGN